MSKNLTRKSLAFGAIVALGTSLFAGAPASALDPVLTVSPSTGSSLSFLSGEKFALKVTSNSAYSWTTNSNLRWEVKNTSGVAVTTTTNAAGTTPSSDSATSATTDATITVDPSGNAGTAAGDNRLGLSVGNDKTATVSVRAYIEDGTTPGLDGNDLASAAVTVSFIQAKDVVATYAFDAPVAGDATAGTTLKFNLNNEQLSSSSAIKAVFKTGTDANLAGISDGTDDTIAIGAFDTTAQVFRLDTTGTTTSIVKDAAVKVQAYYKELGTDSNFQYSTAEKLGSAAVATVVARTVELATAGVVRSVTVKGDASSAQALRNKEFQLKVTAKDNSATPKVVAGAKVGIKIEVGNDGDGNGSAVTLSSATDGKTLTVNGTTYTDKAKLPGASSTYAKIATTTDANGVATVTLKSANFVVGDEITATFYVENITPVDGTHSVSVVSEDADYSGFITNSVYDETSGVSTTDGVAAKVNVSVRDQFGGVPADSYDAVATWASNGQTTASTTDSSTFSAIVAGNAVLSILDNGTGTGVNLYDITFAKRASTGSRTDSETIQSNFRVAIVAAADLVAGKITSTGTLNATTKIYENTSEVALNLNDTGTYDGRLAAGTAPTVANAKNLSGVVSVASSATQAATPIEGAALTITGPAGTQFRDGSTNVYGAGSLTVYTSNTGGYDINVYSNVAGTQTFTLKSGSATQVVTIKFAAAGPTTGTSLVIDAPAYILPGRTLTVTATLKDKYGNPVKVETATDVDIAWAGPGLLVGTMVDAFDADGKATFRVLLGAYETGSGTVTVKYDQSSDDDFTGTATGDLDLVKSATVTIGAAPVVVAPTKANVVGKTKAFSVSVSGNASAKNVVVKVAGKTVATLKGSASAKTYTVKATKGSKKVTVYVGGKLIATKTVSVK